MPGTTQALIEACRWAGALCCLGPRDGDVTAAATDYAAWMAAHREQGGHHRWAKRSKRLGKVVPGHRFAEITAETWRWQVDAGLDEVAREMFRCWMYSSGHWRVAERFHSVWGGAMRKGRNGIWYGCVIVGDLIAGDSR